jgi:hypothetical protein
MDIKPENIIWYPGIYEGRSDPEYTQLVSELLSEPEVLIERVQKRAQEDGQWAIDNHVVGNNEEKMRRFMAFVSDEKNIHQAIEHIRKETQETDYWEKYEPRTVDWICRDLANAAKWLIK